MHSIFSLKIPISGIIIPDRRKAVIFGETDDRMSIRIGYYKKFHLIIPNTIRSYLNSFNKKFHYFPPLFRDILFGSCLLNNTKTDCQISNIRGIVAAKGDAAILLRAVPGAPAHHTRIAIFRTLWIALRAFAVVT